MSLLLLVVVVVVVAAAVAAAVAVAVVVVVVVLLIFLLLLIKYQVVLAICTEMAAGYWLALIFQASHVVSEVGWVNNVQY